MNNNSKSIFKPVADWKNLHVYQKAEVLVLLTDISANDSCRLTVTAL